MSTARDLGLGQGQTTMEQQGRAIGEQARQMGERVQEQMEPMMHREPMQGMWEAMERIPTGAYYFAVGASILISLGFFTAGKKDTAQFIGQWAPTFALLGLMNKLLQPAHSR